MESLKEKPVFPTLGTAHCVPTPASETRARRDAEGMAWIENPAGAGLRFVGYADELAGLSHRGWYTDPDGIDGTVARGAVYQLPARNGRAQYVPAMCDPHNGGPALFDFPNIHIGEKGGDRVDAYGPASDCAIAADSIAENYAERELEYQTAWRAGADYADKGEEMASLRERARELIDATRHDTVGIDRLRGLLSETLGDLQTLREERADLRDRFEVGNMLNRENRSAMLDAFNDGAGIA